MVLPFIPVERLLLEVTGGPDGLAHDPRGQQRVGPVVRRGQPAHRAVQFGRRGRSSGRTPADDDQVVLGVSQARIAAAVESASWWTTE
ncbi:hypothetical protein OIE43_09920 [Streptomyces pseudovenezuelae]|uniref:hypothetical protein n=1 Tax=Streptomyces pseudovenezuelae TaxID=67350 RepID=UPI002E337ECD|nr:hypothetical protein [Streptomyces pseudovenezuelae]